MCVDAGNAQSCSFVISVLYLLLIVEPISQSWRSFARKRQCKAGLALGFFPRVGFKAGPISMRLHKEWFQLWTMILLWLWQRQVGSLDGWTKEFPRTGATVKGPGEALLKMLNVLLCAKTFLLGSGTQSWEMD